MRQRDALQALTMTSDCCAVPQIHVHVLLDAQGWNPTCDIVSNIQTGVKEF